MMDRADRLLASLQAGPKDAVIVYNPSNMFYVSGYSGEGLVILAHGLRAIVTDFRYTEQAGRQSPAFSCHMTSKDRDHEQLAHELLAPLGVETVHYEDDYLTVKAFAHLKERFPHAAFRPLNQAPESLRQFKDALEISAMEKACQITSEAFAYILGEIKEGVTENEIALLLNNWMLRNGGEGLAFQTIVASGENGSLPHAVPGGRRIQAGDMITMDYGAKFGGYCADMTRTVALGRPSDEMLRVYDVVLKAKELAQEAIRPGVVCSSIDAAARDYIYFQGYEGCFGHGLGHSVGIDIHEEPRFSMTCQALTAPGQVITVEPGVYLPKKGGVRVEDSCLITDTGYRYLTTAPRELIIL